jgi:hypothetical protein
MEAEELTSRLEAAAAEMSQVMKRFGGRSPLRPREIVG